jgi:translation initiation factor 2B subunit (eIF-2B alpha/beta/delta family)
VLPDALRRRIDAIEGDRLSGASEILMSCIAVLFDALAAGLVREAAGALCRAQPSMAPVWNASLHALAGAERLRHFADRVDHAPRALARFAAEALPPPPGGAALRIVTLSASRSVRQVIDAVHAQGPLHVSCSDSRPSLEGRGLAAALAGAGIPVDVYADAAIGQALDGVHAVLVGADAVGRSAFLNKSGTRMLAAAAAAAGVPVYVAATRDKFVLPELWPRLRVREEPPDLVWRDPPPGVVVRNPLFERTPLDLVTIVISDLGLLGAGMVPQVCEGMADGALRRALDELSALALSGRPDHD